MSKPVDQSKDTLASYLKENDWEKELNYKLWVTKGARFVAAQRMNAINDASTKAITFLTAYLIIIGLVPTFIPEIGQKVPLPLWGLSTVGISILILAYSLIESSRRYALRSHHYHDCALRIGRLYDVLRQAKSIHDAQAKEIELKRITEEYERVLERFDNHLPIDYEKFQTQKPEYFKLSRRFRMIVWLRVYYHTELPYHVLIVTPPVVIIGLFYFLK